MTRPIDALKMALDVYTDPRDSRTAIAHAVDHIAREYGSFAILQWSHAISGKSLAEPDALAVVKRFAFTYCEAQS